MRTLSNTARIPRFSGIPLGGLVAHLDPLTTGAQRAVTADNVVIIEDRVINRWGFARSPIIGLPQVYADSVINGLYSWISAKEFDDAEESITAAINRVTLMVLWNGKNATDDISGSLQIRQIGDVSAGLADQAFFENPTNGALNNLSGVRPNFVTVGQRSQKMDGFADEHTQVTFIMDKSRRPIKVPSAGGHAWPAGLRPPLRVQQQPISGTMEQGQRGYRITLCNRLLAEAEPLNNNPGLESNRFDQTLLGLPQSAEIDGPITFSGGIRIYFQAPGAIGSIGSDDEFDGRQLWTHLRVYERVFSEDQTDYRLIKQFARAPEFQTLNDDGLLSENVLYNGLTWWAADITQPIERFDGNGPWDFAPERNEAPLNMRYFAQYAGRGWWARDNDSRVFYSDETDAISGGHIEALSGEAIEAFDGPITMLAEFAETLVIGTDRRPWVMTGQLSSFTNASFARNERIQARVPQIEPVQAEAGPVLEGTGSYVIADSRLYYISREGLMRYDGVNVVNVSLGIRDIMTPTDAEAGTTVNDQDRFKALQLASLTHDQQRQLIYMIVPTPIDVDGHDTQQFHTTVFVYHYRRIDASQPGGVGHWTRLTKITDGNSGGRRYTAIGIEERRFDDPRLLVGIRTDFNGTTDQFDNAALVRQRGDDDDRFDVGDTMTGGSPVAWTYETGQWDAGVAELLKKYTYLTTIIKFDPTDAIGLQQMIVVDDVVLNPSGKQLLPQDRFPKMIVGAIGEYIAFRFASTTGIRPIRLFGYTIDAQLAGQG